MAVNFEFKLAYSILHDIYIGGAYSTIALNEHLEGIRSKDKVVRIVYGVLDRDTELDYYIDKLSHNKPKNVARIVLKIALYSIIYMDSMPNYAVVNNAVELIKEIGKREYQGYINALLNTFIKEGVKMPKDEKEKLSITYSKPLWLVKALIKQYGKDKAIEIMSYEGKDEEHIRPNTRRISTDKLEEILRREAIKYTRSNVGGFFVHNGTKVRELFNKGLITMQGKSSMLAVRALDAKGDDEVLDLCAAPGGKSVYISEGLDKGHVLAMELHEHRVELIKAYVRRMRANNVIARQNDATILNEELISRFDKVLVDVPCSGLGVMHKKGDILIGKSMDDINALSDLQYKILNNAIEYVKSGGYLVYSTCTILREENYNIIGRTLKERDDIELVPITTIGMKNEGSIQILPTDGDGLDGFFIAKLRKK